jgi:ubiquinone/menaquinone biosynthesis C-methylase UbiE
MNSPAPRTCPWWLIPTFDNPLRRLVHDPQRILAHHVHPGDTVLDIGCGMGYFTLPLARLVQPGGMVIAADFQPQMLEGLRWRAERAGLLERIRFIQSTPTHIGLDCPLDFVLAFWMVHEVRLPEPFLREIHTALKPGRACLVVEPVIHVPAQEFAQTVCLAEGLGFGIQDTQQVRLSRVVLMQKNQ